VEHPPRKVNQAHLERLRKICMAYPEVVEVTQFGSPWWKAGKKSFCIYGAPEGRSGACFNLSKDHQAFLIEDPLFEKAHYIGQHGWTTLEFRGRVDWHMVEELVDSAYRRVALKQMLKALGEA
jgi:hypothetical protein